MYLHGLKSSTLILLCFALIANFTHLISSDVSSARNVDEVYICGVIELSKSRIDSLIENNRTYSGASPDDSCRWSLIYVRKSEGDYILELVITMPSTARCLVYTPNESVNKGLYRGCVQVFERVLGDNPISLANIYVDEEFSSKINLIGKSLAFIFRDINELGKFFSASSSAIGSDAGRMEDLEITFTGRSPRYLDETTFSDLSGLLEVRFLAECASDMHPLKSTLVISFPASFALQRIYLDLPCFRLHFLNIPEKAFRVKDLTLSFFNMAELFVEMWKEAASHGSTNRDFSTVVCPMWSIERLALWFVSESDRSWAKELPPTFMAFHSDPRVINSAFEWQYHPGMDRSASILGSGLLIGVPSNFERYTSDYLILGNEYLDQFNRPGVHVKELNLFNVEWNVTRPGHIESYNLSLAPPNGDRKTQEVGYDLSYVVTDGFTSSLHVKCLPTIDQKLVLSLGNMTNLEKLTLETCTMRHPFELTSLSVDKLIFLVLDSVNTDNFLTDTVFPCAKSADKECCKKKGPNAKLSYVSLRNLGEEFPPELSHNWFCHMKSLSLFELSNSTSVSSLDPAALQSHPMVSEFIVQNTAIENLPTRFIQNHLSMIDISFRSNKITHVPPEFCVDSPLGSVDLSANFLRKLNFTNVFVNCPVSFVSRGPNSYQVSEVPVNISHNELEELVLPVLEDLIVPKDGTYFGPANVQRTIDLSNNALKSVKIFDRSVSLYPSATQWIINVDISFNMFTELTEISALDVRSLRTLNISYCHLHSMPQNTSQILMQNCCSQHGCVVDLSSNKLVDSKINYVSLFVNTSLQGIYLSNNSIATVPEYISSFPVLVPVNPFESDESTVLSSDEDRDKYFYLTVRLSANPLLELNRSMCSVSPQVGEDERRVFYDFSGCYLKTVKPDIFSCPVPGGFEGFSQDVIAIDLNYNTDLDCINLIMQSENSSLELLSMAKTQVTSLSCDSISWKSRLRSVVFGSPPHGNPYNYSFPSCCNATYSHQSPSSYLAINPDELEGGGGANIFRLARLTDESNSPSACQYVSDAGDLITTFAHLFVESDFFPLCKQHCHSSTCSSVEWGVKENNEWTVLLLVFNITFLSYFFFTLLCIFQSDRCVRCREPSLGLRINTIIGSSYEHPSLSSSKCEPAYCNSSKYLIFSATRYSEYETPFSACETPDSVYVVKQEVGSNTTSSYYMTND